jgi:membrane-bound serine protease (ClpP class)
VALPEYAYVIPIEGEITDPQHYILRRALKEAIDNHINLVILKLNTPGGAVDTTLKMMDSMSKYPGTILAFVDTEALSAGAFLAASTDQIYMTPNGIIGAAAVIQATGQDVPKTARLKLESYLQAKIRTLSDASTYRNEVLRAMSDEDFVLEIDGVVIKPKGELLTLTAPEAIKAYGSPPQSLLAAGIAPTAQAVLEHYAPEKAYVLKHFKVTWSEKLARWLSHIAPLLLGAGMLLLFIEFKTPGFGVFGITGIALVMLVFALNYIAGLAGNEEILLFLCGLMLLAVELFVFPGIIIAGVGGALMILISLVWAMADTWPNQKFEFSSDIFMGPLIDLGIAIAFGLLAALLISRFMPKSWFLDKIILRSQSTQKTGSQGAQLFSGESSLPELGALARTTTDLFPSGEIEFKGNRYQAMSHLGMISKNTHVRVIAHKGLVVIVEEHTA